MARRIAIGPSAFAEEDKTPLELLEQAGCEVIPNPFGRRLTESETIEHLTGVEGLIAGLEPLNRKVLSSARQLKALARVGIGVANVDFDAAREFGIKVSNTPDGPAHAVAELTVTCMLALSRHLVSVNAALHSGEWKKTLGNGLLGATVLLIGFGRIGRKTAEMLVPFGAEIVIHDPFVKEASLPTAVRRVSTLEDGLRQADVVSLHASGMECILDARSFAAMRDGVCLLNSARGELVDEEALVAALDSGKVGGAWFDAFWQEPYKGRLLHYDQVLMTPHLGTYTRQCRRDMELAATKNLLRDMGITT
jgi:D-3-phosphoglycerate dehydrogenase